MPLEKYQLTAEPFAAALQALASSAGPPGGLRGKAFLCLVPPVGAYEATLEHMNL